MSERSRPDGIILAVSLLLLGFGLVMVYSASAVFARDHGREATFFIERQFIRALVGILALAFAYRLGPERLKSLAPIGLGAALVLLLVLLMPGVRGPEVRGTCRWVQLFGVTVQPSEVAKLALILHLARLLSRRGALVQSLQGLFAPVTLFITVAGLVALQPNLGTAIAIGISAMALLFVAGARLAHLAAVGVLCVAGAAVRLVQVPYEWYRIRDWASGNLDPLGAGYQLNQSLIAFGSGGWIGKGVGQGMQKFRFLPDSHTDFIYSIVGEECGIVISVAVLAAYALLIARALAIATSVRDRFASLTAAGIGLMMAVHVLLNVAVVTGLAPTTGLPLPFLSYGGSSLVVNLAAVGILLRLSAERVQVSSRPHAGEARAVAA
jgi:cell division protein FtsW